MIQYVDWFVIPDSIITEHPVEEKKNAETIKKRLDVYNAQTAPLITWYENEGKRHAVKGYGSLEEINAALCAVIDQF